jgi:hypothetical protein
MRPPVVVDARTKQTYVLVRTEDYQRLTGTPAIETATDGIPEGVRLAKAALRRDLPQLLNDRRFRGRYVCYWKEKLVAVNKDYLKLIREINRLEVPDGECFIAKVAPGAGSDEVEEVETCEVVVRGERVRVRANQIILWVSLSLRRIDSVNPIAHPFPVILDTGHTHSLLSRKGT